MDNKKLLSALYDGELTEIEEHQLLRQAGVDSSRGNWMFWQEIRLVGEAIETERRLSPGQHQLLYQRVQQAIEAEADLDAEAVHDYRHSLRHNVLELRRKVVNHIVPLGAMAAMLALAVSLVNLTVMNNSEQPQPVVQNDAVMEFNRSTAAAEELTPVSSSPSQGIPSQLVTEDVMVADAELKALDEDGMQRLRAYLSQHDQMTQLPRKSRFAKYPGPIEK